LSWNPYYEVFTGFRRRNESYEKEDKSLIELQEDREKVYENSQEVHNQIKNFFDKKTK